MPKTPDNPWLIIIGLLFTGLSSIGIKEIVVGMLGRKPKRVVEVANQIDLAKQTQVYAQQLEEDAAQARESARKAWAQVDEVQQKLVAVNRNLDATAYRVEEVGRYLDRVMDRIFARGATIEDVQEWIRAQPPPSRNGRGGPQN